MSTIRVTTLFVATLLVASNAVAQSCVGNPMARKNYIGLSSRSSWTGKNQQHNLIGGEYAHRFDLGENATLTAGLGIAAREITKDSSAGNVAGTLMLSTRVLADPNLSICAGTGFEARGLDKSASIRSLEDGYFSVPLTVGLGYDVQFGSATITPFVAPTLARYEFESLAVQNGARQHGWDGYVTMGASAVMGPMSLTGSYRRGDHSLDNKGRWLLGSGFSF